jgi:hypothetical protein
MRIEDKILIATYLLSDKGKKPVELIKLKAFIYLLEKENKTREMIYESKGNNKGD